MAEIRVDPKKLTGPVELRVGDTLVLGLEENPTTGYRWQVSTDDQLTPSADRFIPAGDAAAGGGGVRTLKFAVVTGGAGQIKLQLRREWAVDAPQQSLLVTYRAK